MEGEDREREGARQGSGELVWLVLGQENAGGSAGHCVSALSLKEDLFFGGSDAVALLTLFLGLMNTGVVYCISGRRKSRRVSGGDLFSSSSFQKQSQSTSLGLSTQLMLHSSAAAGWSAFRVWCSLVPALQAA